MKTIGVREFLRGGYQQVDKPTVVLSHSRVVGIWMPYDEEDEPITLNNNTLMHLVEAADGTSQSD